MAFLNSHPIQYAAPLYAYLDRTPDIEPVALYLSDFSLRGAVDRQFGREVVWDIDLLAGYEYHFVGPNWRTDRPDGFFDLKGAGLWQALGSGGFDALVLHGHNHLANLVALAAARFHRIPVLYKAETHLLLPRSRFKGALRPAALRALFSQVAGFLYIGSRNRAFYRSLGIADDRLWFYPYTVDNDRFRAYDASTSRERIATRRSLGLADDVPVVTYASKFMPRKHPDHLILAAKQLIERGSHLQLLMIGSGELEGELRALADSEPRLKTVFAGFMNQSELPRALGASDVFVLPSEDEPFGLIVNEAMCAGLPVVASEEVGCVGDLVRDGENGATFAAGDVAGLAAALGSIVDDPALRAQMAERSITIIAAWAYSENLAGLRAALSQIVEHRK